MAKEARERNSIAVWSVPRARTDQLLEMKVANTSATNGESTQITKRKIKKREGFR
jgi:hypothetical protein